MVNAARTSLETPGHVDRVNVNLTKRAAQTLEALVAENAATKTDVINRAILAYAFLENEVGKGNEVLIRTSDGEVQRVQFL